MDYETAKRILAWAAMPGPHGGNPYTQYHVQEAERIAAAQEGREVDGWAREPKSAEKEVT